MSEYIAKAPIEPRDYRVVFIIQENGYQKVTVMIYYTVINCGITLLKTSTKSGSNALPAS